MRVCNLATALILFAAHASASHTEGELIDISELWDELQEDEDMQEIKDELESADADLYAEYWGYIEGVVAIYFTLLWVRSWPSIEVWMLGESNLVVVGTGESLSVVGHSKCTLVLRVDHWGYNKLVLADLS